MHYHLSQTIVHITLNLILMKQQEVWQQVPASIEKTKNILLFSQTTIYNKYKCINKTCFIDLKHKTCMTIFIGHNVKWILHVSEMKMLPGIIPNILSCNLKRFSNQLK